MAKHYLIMYRPPRPTFVDDISPDESLIIEKHFDYLKDLHNKGIAILVGRVADARFGLAVIAAADETEAESLMANDPAVRHEVFSGEVLEFRLALPAQES